MRSHRQAVQNSRWTSLPFIGPSSARITSQCRFGEWRPVSDLEHGLYHPELNRFLRPPRWSRLALVQAEQRLALNRIGFEQAGQFGCVFFD